MPPLNLPGWRWLGRPVKPVAFGLMALSLIIGISNLYGQGTLDHSIWAKISVVLGLSAFGTLALAWFRCSQKITERGLLLVFLIFVARFFFVMIQAGPSDPEGYESLAVALIAAGTYMLESSDLLGLQYQKSPKGER